MPAARADARRFQDADVLRQAGGVSEPQPPVAIGEKRADRSDAKFLRKVTRNPVRVQFPPEDDGKVATYYARWASPRGETGPWSLPVSMRIAA